VVTWPDAFAFVPSSWQALPGYSACTLYILNGKQKFVPILIVVLALTAIGAGLAGTFIPVKSLLHFDNTEIPYVLQSAATLACDIVITVSLLYILGGHKNENLPDATNNMLDKLMVIAINRGVLTSLCAAINIILFLSIPGTFWFFLGIVISGKLYMNSALASLNSRQYINDSSTDSNNWHFPAIRSTPAREDESQIRFQS